VVPRARVFPVVTSLGTKKDDMCFGTVKSTKFYTDFQ
jgi:hypothetical protein